MLLEKTKLNDPSLKKDKLNSAEATHFKQNIQKLYQSCTDEKNKAEENLKNINENGEDIEKEKAKEAKVKMEENHKRWEATLRRIFSPPKTPEQLRKQKEFEEIAKKYFKSYTPNLTNEQISKILNASKKNKLDVDLPPKEEN